MKFTTHFRMGVLFALSGALVSGCFSIPSVTECPVRPLTTKEKAFAAKYDPDMLYTTIWRVDYEYRDNYPAKHGCKLRNSMYEYSYMFENESVESFVDTATIRKIAFDRIAELYSNVISDSVLFAVKSFNVWLENDKHLEAAEEGETHYELDVMTAEVANYVGFKVVKQGNKLVRVTVPKTASMKLERESFDPLIKRLPGDN